MGKLLDGIYNAISGLDGPAVRVGRVPLIDLATGGRAAPAGALDAYYSNAFRACLIAKARPLSSLPIDVYKRGDGVRERSNSHVSKRLSKLLRHRWNPLLTGPEGIRWAMMTKDTLGNAYIRVEWSRGMPVALWPMSGEPEVSLLPGGGAAFDYAGDKRTPAGRYLSHEVLWVKSPVLDADGVRGLSLAELAARELGLSIDLEAFYEKLISNGSHFPQWIETDSRLDDRAMSRLKDQLADHRGITSAGEMRVFDSGMRVRQTEMSIADMSLVEQETWVLQQCCRTLSVPPQQVYDLSHATYSNAEQGAMEFAKNTLVPECSALERAFTDVLASAGLDDDYVQFDLNGLMRGDYKSRMEGYRTGILSGFFTPNQAASWEDLPPFEGGDVHLFPSAYSTVDPETGEVTPGSGADVGGSGEGVAPSGVGRNGRPGDALAPVHADMERRVRERFAERGDTAAARGFAARVLAPYAEACSAAGIEYDMEADIERMAGDA